MADVKWIKITTDIFDDEKILLLESLPEADSIIVIWFKLLCLAGKMNNNGVFTMSNRIAYTDKMLATIFRRREATVQLALQTFEQFGMIEVIDGVITIPNWEKHQNIEGMEKIREQTRKRVANHREKQKLISSNVSCNVTVTECNATDKIREDKNRLEEDNNICDSDESQPAPAKKVVKHKYGEYNNVLLTDEELQKLKAEYSDIEERIERLSSYVASTGKKYKSHYATIRNWARKDAETKPIRKEPTPKWMPKTQNNYDFDELEKALAPVMVDDDPKLKEEAEALKKVLQEKY
jgi:predicted phage replisome organizer